MRQPSDPDGAKYGNAFDGTSVLIAGGAPAERRAASPPKLSLSPPSSPENRLWHPQSRSSDLNQQQYNLLHRSVVSPVVQGDHQQYPKLNKITNIPAPQQAQYNRTGKQYHLVDLDVTILGDDSLIEPHSSPTTTSITTSDHASDHASPPQLHRDSANVSQPQSPSTSSSRNNTNTVSSPQQPQPAHGLNFKDQARSVGTISAEAVVAVPDHGAYDRHGAALGFDTLVGTSSNVPANHLYPHAVIARRTSPPPPSNQHPPPPRSPQQQHPTSRPPPRNDSNPAPPSARRQPSYHTPEETIFSFAVPKQQKGCGCVIQ